jgi:hypothetical protein
MMVTAAATFPLFLVRLVVVRFAVFSFRAAL